MLVVMRYVSGIGIRHVKLDDHSIRYREKDNIYLKVGMRYDNTSGPEMYGLTRKIASKWGVMKKKYGWENIHIIDTVPVSSIGYIV
jgi:hypothetical protein